MSCSSSQILHEFFLTFYPSIRLVFLMTKNMLDRPATTHPVANDVVGKAEFSRPVRHALCLASEAQHSVVARILRQLSISGPATILFAVSLIVLLSLNRMPFAWARPHVRVERLKAIAPLIANGNSSSAVSVIPSCLRVGASLNDVVPNPVFGSSAHAVRLNRCSHAMHPLAST